MSDHTEVELRIAASAIGGLIPLLGQGVGIDAPLGISLQHWLSVQLAFGDDYVANRIQSIFVNGKPVDDEQNTTVTHGAVIALSAAMPGLVGATLRKDGLVAGMRSTISHAASAPSDERRNGRVTLKLFNMIAREMGICVLSQGVWISGEQMVDTLKSLALFGMPSEQCCQWDGMPMDPGQLAGKAKSADHLFLRVVSPPDDTQPL
jgi:hypothetical protein